MRIVRLVIFGALIVGAGRARACSVPVFRYALNYWPADEYELRARGAKLPSTDFTVNLGIKDSPGEAKLVFGERELWSGEMNPAVLGTLLDSPARREIVSRILRGDSVIWVLVECGDRAKDDAVAEALTKRLKYLESIAVMPEIRPDDPLNQVGPGPTLAIRHSVIRLSRADPREKFTVAMLERGAGGDGKAPAAYPVFGRGRVLIALPEEKLTQDNIDEVSQFLTAACSCEVKDRRQGWDLLLAVDWDEKLAKVEQKRLNGTEGPTAAAAAPVAAVEEVRRPTTQGSGQSKLAPETVQITARGPAAAAAAPVGSLGLPATRMAIAATAVILAGVFGGIWMRKRV